MPRTYRACLIGCGRMGATIDDEVEGRPDRYLWQPFSHAAAAVACDRTDLVAVSDVVAEKAESIRQRYGAERAYTDYRQMIEKEQPDIVCIATRPGPHADITVFAAENNVKGIYCEKPLCCSMEEADAMVDVVQKYGVKFNYGTQRRYMPVYRKVRELVDAGEIGNIQCTIAQYGASSALWGLTHAADMLLFLASDPEVDFVQGLPSSVAIQIGMAIGWTSIRRLPVATSVLPMASTAITPRAPVPNSRSAVAKGRSASSTTAENANSAKRATPSLKRYRSQTYPAPPEQ